MAKEPSFAVSFLMSVVLHLAAAGGAVAAYLHKPPVPPRNVERLIVQLEGRVSRLQVEEKMVAEEKPEEKPEEEPPVEEPVKPPPKPVEKKKVKPVEKIKPAKETAIEKIEKPKETPPKDKPRPPQEQVEVFQQQQRIAAVQDEMRLINRYLISFKRKLAEHLVYPREARRSEYIGMPTVRLSILIDGSVPAGSLAILKSSGHAALDEAAIDAVRRSSPFPPPPKVLENVAVEIVFKVE